MPLFSPVHSSSGREICKLTAGQYREVMGRPRALQDPSYESSRRCCLLRSGRPGLGGAFVALVFAFALSRLVSRLQMSARVAAHIALHAKRPVAPFESAFEWTFARVAVNMDPEAAGAGETLSAVSTLILCRCRFKNHQPRWNDGSART